MSARRPATTSPQAHVRLEERRALEAAANLPPDEVTRILAERARALARPREAAPTPGAVLELLVFSLAGERYGIETVHVLDVLPLRELTPVPCTPPTVLGVINHRGRILPVLDFRRLFELSGHGVTGESRVVAAEAGGMAFGIYTEAVAGTIRVGTHEVAPPPAILTSDRQAVLRGVTGEMLAVLDLEVLARDPRIAVNDEVG